MRVAIVGSRDFTDYQMVKDTMRWFVETYEMPTDVVTGDAGENYPENKVEITKSADMFAVRWAEENNILPDVKRADWNTHGKAAGPLRNTVVIETNPEFVIAFWNDDLTKRSGTRDTVLKAFDKGIPVISINMFTGHMTIYPAKVVISA
jgi:hypothetical protein